MVKAFWKYRKQAVNEHGIHSPFVFEFYNEVVKKIKDVDDHKIQQLRKSLSKDRREIEITDLGVGSKKSNNPKKRISEMARMAPVSAKYGKLLQRIVEHYKIENSLELGTSLGLGTAYLSTNSNGTVFTIEGCPNIQMEAIKNLEGLGIENVEFINAEFSEGVPDLLEKLDKIDLFYVDGNHGYAPTMKYFQWIIEKAHNDTFMIFDDINWSADMRKAWDEICQSEKINVSMELFRMGIVLKREEQEKQHFVLKF